MGDDRVCLVSVEPLDGIDNMALSLWLLCDDGAAMDWELQKVVPMSEVLGKKTHLCYDVSAVNAGMVLLSSKNDQLVIDLNKFNVVAKCRLEAHAAYPYQIRWPPVELVATGNVSCLNLAAGSTSVVGDTAQDSQVGQSEEQASEGHSEKRTSGSFNELKSPRID
ncbi:hypothetical protein ACP4OV_023093 [Aristida adscensionis]